MPRRKNINAETLVNIAPGEAKPAQSQLKRVGARPTSGANWADQLGRKPTKQDLAEQTQIYAQEVGRLTAERASCNDRDQRHQLVEDLESALSNLSDILNRGAASDYQRQVDADRDRERRQLSGIFGARRQALIIELASKRARGEASDEVTERLLVLTRKLSSLKQRQGEFMTAEALDEYASALEHGKAHT